MIIVEKKRMERWDFDGNTVGYIPLENLAKPETVKVTVLGEEITPDYFNDSGSPVFTKEQMNLYDFKADKLRRQDDSFRLMAKISYEPATFDVPTESFNSISGIKKNIKSLSSLNKMLKNRRLFYRADPDNELEEFMLFGFYYLNSCGGIMSIDKTYTDTWIPGKDVESYSDFHNRNKGYTLSDEYVIPPNGKKCPCCMKAFTIDDVKNNPCVKVRSTGTYYHETCWRDYRKQKEIYMFTCNLMDMIYKKTDYTFELLPNGYCNRRCCSHIPWFKFHTIDGDIIIGWRKRVISIEWQENYKPFDMKLFSKEDVTKWNRGIHAWGENKAYEYLQKVVNAVHPEGYKNF